MMMPSTEGMVPVLDQSRVSYTPGVAGIMVTARGSSRTLIDRLDLDVEYVKGSGSELAHRLDNARPVVVIHSDLDARALLAGLERNAGLEHLIILSDPAVHGTSARMPSVVPIDTCAPSTERRLVRSLRRLETEVRDFAHQRPDVTLTVLRFASLLGDPGPMSRHLFLHVVPSILGFDPRLQFLHIDDAALTIRHTLTTRPHGTFNIAAPGQTYLSRAIRLGRRRHLPLPEPIFRRLDLPGHLVDLFKHGRVVEPTPPTFGYSPGRTCRESLIDFYGG